MLQETFYLNIQTNIIFLKTFFFFKFKYTNHFVSESLGIKSVWNSGYIGNYFNDHVFFFFFNVFVLSIAISTELHLNEHRY